MKTFNATLELLPWCTVTPLRNDYDVIAHARSIIESRLRKPGEMLNFPTLAKNLFVLRLADKERKVLEAAFLDAENRMIAVETLFTGTLRQTGVLSAWSY